MSIKRTTGAGIAQTQSIGLSWSAADRLFYQDREELRAVHTAPSSPVPPVDPDTRAQRVDDAMERLQRIHGAACTIRRR